MNVKQILLRITLLGLTLLAVTPLAGVWANEPDDVAFDAPAAGRMSTSLSPSMAVPRPTLTTGSPRDPEARFDLTVNNAPAAQVFLQMGAGSAYNVLVSPDLSGTITIGLKNTTVPEALDVLRELFGYDYRINGNRVFVYPNTVQTRLFRVNYLQGRRRGASDLRVSSTSITQSSSGSSSSSSSSSSGSSGSAASASNAADTSSVRTTSDSDFWKDVEDSLKAMIGTQGGRSVTINSTAGMVVVRATPAELRHVADYLRAVQLNIERQVMLEAKIIEVQLSKSSESGVNWSLFRTNSNGARSGIVNIAPGVTLSNSTGLSNANGSVSLDGSASALSAASGLYGLAIQGSNFAAMISFLETQGNVQVLSSPRIATLNNQKAVLKVGSDEMFVTGVTNNTTSTSSSTTSAPTINLSPFFSGIALDVTPQIDDGGTVMLHVHPVISSVSEKSKTIDLGDQGTYTLPLAASSISETDSIVRVQDGHIVAIGGLMSQSSTTDGTGVPGLSQLPVMGGLFRSRSSSDTKHELVILIKPTVINEDGVGWTSSEPSTPLLGKATLSRTE
jgi:MSHA biogenesis protein MshL